MARKKASELFRDYVTDGVPASGAHPPVKSDLRNYFGNKLDYGLTLEDFNTAAGSGSDDTTAMTGAIAESTANGGLLIFLLPGKIYNLTDITVGAGVPIIGLGGVGATVPGDLGCWVRHNSNGDLFTFDGSGWDGTHPIGVGGMLKNINILKGTGYAGGNGYLLKAITNAGERAGEMVLENLLIFGEDAAATWAHCGKIDGSLVTTAGSAGVRSVQITKVRGASCSTVGQTFVVDTCVHLRANGWEADLVGGITPGFYFQGLNDNIDITGLDTQGTLQIIANDANNATTNFNVRGGVSGSCTINDALVNGTLDLSGLAGLNVKSPYLHVRSPGWSVNTSYNASTTAANETGDGTPYSVVFDEEEIDSAGLATGGLNYSVVVSGRYRVSGQVTITGVGAGHTSAIVTAVTSGKTRSVSCVPSAIKDSGGAVVIPFNFIMDLTSGNSLQIIVVVSGSTKTVGVYGTAGGDYTFWHVDYLGPSY